MVCFGFMATSLSFSLLGPVATVHAFGEEKGYLLLCIVSAIASFVSAIYFYLVFEKGKEQTTKEALHQAV